MTDNEKRFIKSIFSGDSSGHDYYHTNRAKLEPFDKINAGNPHKYRFSAF